MTATITKACDVFISHGPSDLKVAGTIAECVKAVGLQPFYRACVEPGADLGDAIQEALRESRAVIAIISPDLPFHAMGYVEIGAAWMWDLPVYLVINGPTSTNIPSGLGAYPVFPLTRLEEAINAIRTGVKPLSDADRDSLVSIYRDLNTSVDRLIQSPNKLGDLSNQFSKRTHKTLSGERLLSEILRLRKQGDLPLSHNGVAKA